MNSKIKNWQGQRVWVIGASSGIGAETARILQARGARLALTARNAAGLQHIANGHTETLIDRKSVV